MNESEVFVMLDLLIQALGPVLESALDNIENIFDSIGDSIGDIVENVSDIVGDNISLDGYDVDASSFGDSLGDYISFTGDIDNTDLHDQIHAQELRVESAGDKVDMFSNFLETDLDHQRDISLNSNNLKFTESDFANQLAKLKDLKSKL